MYLLGFGMTSKNFSLAGVGATFGWGAPNLYLPTIVSPRQSRGLQAPERSVLGRYCYRGGDPG